MCFASRLPGILAPLVWLHIAPAIAEPQSQRFSTPLAAATAAASHYNPISIREGREFLGAIVRDGDWFAFTTGAGARYSHRVTVRIPIEPGTEVVAFWHTHGRAAAASRYFSEVDVELVKRWRKPFYLADHTGRLKVLRPGSRVSRATRGRHSQLPAGTRYATGNLVRGADGHPVTVPVR